MEKVMLFNGKQNGYSELNHPAESLLASREATLDELSPQMMKELIHELLLRQEELRLQNEILQHHQRQLEAQKLEAVAQLAGGVAHHFNNMLTAILGYVDLSLDDLQADHPVANNLQIVKKTAQRAATLTSQLLAFTRQTLIRPQIANLNDSILNMEPALEALVGKTIHLTLFLAPELNEVKIDLSQFEQLLLHLVTNGREAMPEGGQLTLETANISVDSVTAPRHPQLPAGDYVRLTVIDTGRGMTETVKRRIFEPFFTTKEVGQGTGLGLATCWGIVQQHQGDITVESQPGQGTTFNIYLPCISTPQLSGDQPGYPPMFLPEAEPTANELAVPICY
jgi:two-component system, cell cycle sensor histidine kinase and response regulator CckA